MPLSLDFAFEGFRIIREKPKLVFFWGLVLLIGGSVSQLLLVAIGGPYFERMQAMKPTADPATVLPILQHVMAAYAAAIPVWMVTGAVLSCAVFRATWNAGGDVDDGAGRFGYLRFGTDEVRQIFVVVLFYLFVFLTLFAEAFVSGLLGSLAGAAGAAVEAALSFVGLFGVALVALRLSLCGAQSFDRKTIDLFGSWKLTARHGWALLGGYVVTAIMCVFVMTLCIGTFGALVMVANSGQWAAVDQLLHPDLTSLSAYLKPTVIAWIVIGNLLVAPLVTALTSGAQAAAYRTLAGQTPDQGI